MVAAKGNNYTLKRKKNPQHTEEQIELLIKDLLDWAENAKDIHITGWTRKQKKTRPWLNELAERHPKMKEAYQEAMALLGRKVLNSSFYGEGNATVGMQYLPIYDSDFKELLKWKAEIQKEQVSEEKSKSAVIEYLKQQEEKNKKTES